MPKHFKNPEEAWDVFLKTIKAGETITVTQVTPAQITFTIQPEELPKFRSLLADPEALKSQILHTIRNAGDVVLPHTQQLTTTKPVPQNPKEWMYKLFGKGFLAQVGVSDDTLEKFQDNPLRQTATVKLDGSSLENERDLIEFKILQHTIDQKLNLSNIIYGDDTFNKQSLADVKGFAREVLQIDSDKSTATLNYGVLVQAAQTQNYDFNPPVVASTSTDNEFTLDRTAIFKYLAKVFPSGLIFQQPIGIKELPAGHVLPVMFAENADENSLSQINLHEFHIILDVSGSMKGSFDNYIEGFNYVIGKFVNTVSSWKITISAFNTEVTQKVFSSTNGDTADSIAKFTTTLDAKGETDLNCVLSRSLVPANGQHSTLIIFTDGEDTVNKCTPQQILDSASAARANPQFAMYSIGYGKNYNADFFKSIATQCGFTHIHLDDVKQLESQFGRYIDNIGTQRALYEFFLQEGKHFFEQVQGGEIAIGEPIPLGTKVMHDGIEIALVLKKAALLLRWCLTLYLAYPLIILCRLRLVD